LITTKVFVELLITGLGGLIWIGLLVFCFLDINISLEIIKNQNLSYLLLPTIGIAYIIGILIDRYSYRIFSKCERKQIKSVFYEKNIKYPRDINGELFLKPIISYINESSEDFKYQITFNKTRQNLCANWIINFLFISISLAINLITNGVKFNYSILAALPFLILSLLSLIMWKKLTIDYLKNIKTSYIITLQNKWNNKKCEINYPINLSKHQALKWKK
jgi:hypothetical protein